MLLCTELDAQNRIPHGLSLSVREFTEEYWQILEKHEYGLCYTDLRFDNLLADSNGKIWLLDYETLCAAPKDYILDTLYRMGTSPLWDKNEENVRDGATLMELLKKYEVKLCCYGHIHGKGCSLAFNGWRDGTEYKLVSAGFVDFTPIKLRNNS